MAGGCGRLALGGADMGGCEDEGKKSGPWRLLFNNFVIKTTCQVAAFLSSENITVDSSLLYVIRQKLKLSKTKFYYCVST